MHDCGGVRGDARSHFGGRARNCVRGGWMLIALSLCGLVMAEIGEPAAAQAQTSPVTDAAYVALGDYVRLISADQRPPLVIKSSAAAGDVLDHETYAALRELTQRIARDEPELAPAVGIEVAEATNAFDALRDYLQKGNGGPPPAPVAPPPSKAITTKAAPKPGIVDATYVGSKPCAACHSGHVESFGETLMGKLYKQGKLQCETCHGPGSAHVKAGGGRGVGGLVSFRADDITREPKQNNAICLGCHERGDRTYWSGSPHETRDVACTNCHTIMKRVSVKFNLKTAVEPETCFQCHKDNRAQMVRSSHMPLREGKMVCSDCHNPHGSTTEALLKTDSINDTCYKCHADKRGPFLFEHLPVRENCASCHDPHGSVNEFMLKVSRPRLCAECHGIGHGLATGANAVQAMSRSCQNCHTEVHGTNSPSGALLHR
jgi:DmsE family decaheme c-type cytochrome